MTIKSACYTLTITLFLLFAKAALAAETVPDQASVISGIPKARALVKDGKFDEALTVLRPLTKAHPKRVDVLFLQSLAAIGGAQILGAGEQDREALLDEAIAALHTILVDRPNLIRPHLELAKAFFLKEEDDLARDHFERVLAGKPPAPVVANIQRFLTEIRARKRWTMYLGIAAAPSTNIGRTSNAEVININDLPFRRDASELTTSGVGVSAWAGGEYQYPLGDRLRLRFGGDAARQEYSGSKFDQIFLSGHAGPRWLADQNTDISLLANVRQRWYGSAPYYRDFGTRLEIGRRLTRNITLGGRGSWHRRQYRVYEFLDGPVLDFSLDGTWLITPIIRAEMAGGYGQERARRKTWRNATRWGRVGASVALPLGFTLGGSGEFRWTKYKGNWFPFTTDGVPRKDRTRILRASVYNRAFTLFGFSPQIAVTHEVRKTNAQLYDYKNTNLELRFVRQF